jgi:hypothetical protein
MNIASLPNDVFLLIVAYLGPDDLVRGRRVSRAWQAALESQPLCLSLLKWHFPHAREMRLARAVDAVRSLPEGDGAAPDSFQLLLQLEWERQATATTTAAAAGGRDWAATFAGVARRYHGLARARPRACQSIPLLRAGRATPFVFREVGTWDRCLELHERKTDFHYPDPRWAYAREDALLVYPAGPGAEEEAPGDERGWRVLEEEERWGPADYKTPQRLLRPAPGTGRPALHPVRCAFRLLDLATGAAVRVPFNVERKIVRRLRLAFGVLVIEWAEEEPCHALNERTVVHRHWVSSFTVCRRRAAPQDPRPFDSVHGAASPLWTWEVTWKADWKMHFLGLPLTKVDRFLSAHDGRHYALYLWQPNRNPYGEGNPLEVVIVWDMRTGAQVAKLKWLDLEFLGLRQRHTPTLRELRLDGSGTLYAVAEEHRWAAGPHSSAVLPRTHMLRTTAFPVAPAAPAAAEDEDPRQDKVAGELADLPLGPRWESVCGAEGEADTSMSFCADRRPALPPPLLPGPNLDVDVSAVRRGPCFAWEGDAATQTLSSSATHPYDTGRWAGEAPCWRHEHFPYLTVTQAVDAAAGVRVAARHCFLFDTVSMYVAPQVVVEVPRGGRSRAGLEEEEEEEEAAAGSRERAFADDVWARLMAKGSICGDERWVVGEAEGKVLTVLRF